MHFISRLHRLFAGYLSYRIKTILFECLTLNYSIVILKTIISKSSSEPLFFLFLKIETHKEIPNDQYLNFLLLHGFVILAYRHVEKLNWFLAFHNCKFHKLIDNFEDLKLLQQALRSGDNSLVIRYIMAKHDKKYYFQ